MNVTPNLPAGTILYNGYRIILTHGDCALIQSTSHALPWVVHTRGESHYFGDFFVAVESFKEDCGL